MGKCMAKCPRNNVTDSPPLQKAQGWGNLSVYGKRKGGPARPVTFTDPTGTCLLQFDSVTNTLGKCGVDPNKDRQCACLCSIATEYQKCIKDCKDGCLASSFSAVESCQCL